MNELWLAVAEECFLEGYQPPNISYILLWPILSGIGVPGSMPSPHRVPVFVRKVPSSCQHTP